MISALLLALQTQNPLAHTVDPIRTHQNILHYDFSIAIDDEQPVVSAVARVHYRPEADNHVLVLDFTDSLRVFRVFADGEPVVFHHAGDTLVIDHWGAIGDSLSVTITYGGRPPDGLFIQANVHGARTAFADNWPNRAHFWLPVEDHPSDKASVSWSVEVPARWKVVANGRLVDTTRQNDGRITWRYHEPRRIPAYTFVIGAGEMTVTPLLTLGGVPQSLWSYREDSAWALAEPFARVNTVVDALEEYIGPFPYDKLAHVESSTRFGGMENSGAIFYTERGYAGRSMREPLVVHETAHQWFGDAATEYDWHHLWLSEGFATYFAALFYELVGEPETFRARMENARQSYVNSNVVDRPILDFSETDYMRLLNANNYPKGGWVLHMLRREIGDDAFRTGMRDFYATYRDSTALSQDLLDVMERSSGRQLDWFFTQWLTQPGYPQLHVAVSRDAGEIAIEQVQPAAWGTFRIPVRVDLINSDTGDRVSVTVPMDGRRARRDVTVPRGADTIVVDPDADLLHQARAVFAESAR